MENGLPQNTVQALVQTQDGFVWLGTEVGLVRFDGNGFQVFDKNTRPALPGNDVRCLLAAKDGALWIGTSDGLAHLLHPERVFDPIPLAVSVTGIRRGDSLYPAAQEITLPWSATPLQLQILSSTMRNRSELAFKYRMQGLEPDWAESQNGLAVFSAVPPGNYTFEAMAGNSSLGAESAAVKVRVKILAPWWRSDWFYGLCAVAVLLLFAAVNRLYERHLRARSRELECMVGERTRELEKSRERLRIQATHDGLTGMLNRIAILRAMTVEMDRAQREDRTVIVALIDLDHFKRINDAYGHLAGDEALRWFAAAVETAIRPYDHAGRYGGEEFLLVLTQVPRQATEQRLDSLHASISKLQVNWRGLRFRITCSMGAVVFDPSDVLASVESLLSTADQALYAAKAAGRDRVVLQQVNGMDVDHESPAETLAEIS
jgi:diguanylate cyclase (GGDEF)-like protein